jgi:beta-galactosidase
VDEFEAPVFNEMLFPLTDDVQILARYTSDYYAGKPAVSLRRQGEGRVVQFGCFFTEENVTGLLDALGISDPLETWAEIPAEVQATVRANRTERFCLLLNFTGEQKMINFKDSALDLLEEEELQGPSEIPQYGVRLVRY